MGLYSTCHFYIGPNNVLYAESLSLLLQFRGVNAAEGCPCGGMTPTLHDAVAHDDFDSARAP